MKKKLRIDELRVDTFATARVDGARGTVRAHEDSAPHQCASGVWTCLDTCDVTCGATCNGSCVYTCDTCVDTCICA
ncbi:MAG TPA: hypothetical protein VF771_06345 [Longimicrobiaceae bacterium]